jgi:hypothetical protein
MRSNLSQDNPVMQSLPTSSSPYTHTHTHTDDVSHQYRHTGDSNKVKSKTIETLVHYSTTFLTCEVIFNSNSGRIFVSAFVNNSPFCRLNSRISQVWVPTRIFDLSKDRQTDRRGDGMPREMGEGEGTRLGKENAKTTWSE